MLRTDHSGVDGGTVAGLASLLGRRGPWAALTRSYVGVALVGALTLACTSDDAPTDELSDESDESGESESGETGGEPQWPTVDLDALPYEYLSEYGFFVGEELAALEPASGVIPYTVVSPLFSDFAGKARFIYLPEGEQLHIDFAAASPGPGGEG